VDDWDQTSVLPTWKVSFLPVPLDLVDGHDFLGGGKHESSCRRQYRPSFVVWQQVDDRPMKQRVVHFDSALQLSAFPCDQYCHRPFLKWEQFSKRDERLVMLAIEKMKCVLIADKKKRS
jgi:hypothetical protein